MDNRTFSSLSLNTRMGGHPMKFLSGRVSKDKRQYFFLTPCTVNLRHSPPKDAVMAISIVVLKEGWILEWG